jgi:hypothetical protein
MDKNQRLGNIYFLLGLGLTSLFAYTLLFCTISFVRGHSISSWQFLLSVVMMLVTQYFASKEFFELQAKKVFLQTSGILISLIFLSIVFANIFYDVSFDGQWYHQETIARLKQGWNPYLKELSVPKKTGVPDPRDAWCLGPHIDPVKNANGDEPVLYIKYVSLNYFVKGVEITQTAIYALTKKIETGKAINVICLLASLFLTVSALYKMGRWKTGKIWLIVLLFCMNPVTIYQLTSFCVDGLMYSMLLSLIAVFILIYLEKNKYALFLFGLLVMICVNIKFTTVVYAGLFCACFFAYLLIKRNTELVKKFLVAGIISFLIGFIFIGFHPYMTSLIKYNTPFHGLDETRNVNALIKPEYFYDKNRFTDFLISYNARTYDSAAKGGSLKTILKVPFSINKAELLSSNEAEVKLAGFGPFFSGALLVSLILLAVLAIYHYRERPFGIALFGFGFLFISIFMVPDPWWARFVPQFWLFPVIILFVSENISFRSRFLKPALYISISLNIAWALFGVFLNLLIAAHINYQIDQLKTVTTPISVEYCGYVDMTGNRMRFEENNIPFVERNVTGKHIYNVIRSNTRFETTEELPEVPKSLLMQLNEKLHGKNSD